MVSKRLPTLEFKLAGTSCTKETIPTIRMALARIICSREKPLCFRPCLAKLRFAFATLILAPALHPRPWAASGGLPKLGLPHGDDGDRPTPVLRLVRISKSQEIRPCWATGRIIHCSAVVERDGAGKITFDYRGTVNYPAGSPTRSEEHTSELQSHLNLVCRLLLEKKKMKTPRRP